jgi:hypothetical protein
MARPLRIEYAGAVYHVMARGNHGQSLFADDQDRHLVTLGGPEAGDGALQPGIARRGPDEIQTGEEIAGTQKAAPGGRRDTGMKHYVTFLSRNWQRNVRRGNKLPIRGFSFLCQHSFAQ